MIKISKDEHERYLYLREQMAISDKVSQLHSAEKRGIELGIQQGVQQGELLKTYKRQVQSKKNNGDSVKKIAEDLLEDTDTIQKIYDEIQKNPEKNKNEICNHLLGL